MFERLADVELDEPVLVMGMEGWIDAGLGGAAAMATLVEQVPNQVIARFDTDLLLDQRARRPVLRIVDGVTSPLTWPEIELVMLVKQLLYTEKYTIDGARQKIDEYRKSGELRTVARAALDSQAVESMETELRSILAILDGQPEETRTES